MPSLKASCAAAVLVTSSASAALYQHDFEVNDTENWITNSGPAGMDAAADFFFDYSTVGIPSAPSGTGTRGLKIQANLESGIFGGVSVSPVSGASLPSNYTLTFDWWSNTVGPFPAGGSGSTNLSTFGVGTAGTTAQRPGVADSTWFAASGEGGTAADFRAYSTAAVNSYPDSSAVYAATDGPAPNQARNNTNPYYSSFGNVAPPTAQTAIYPNQSGEVAVGTMAFAWHQVTIEKNDAFIKWIVDGIEIATVDATTVTHSGTNIFFGHSDIKRDLVLRSQ